MKIIFYAYEMTVNVPNSNRIQYRQLLFGGTNDNPTFWKKLNWKVRYVPQKENEEETIKAFDEKYNVKCKWTSMGYGNDAHLGYQIFAIPPAVKEPMIVNTSNDD
jgi:hypothetical protein